MTFTRSMFIRMLALFALTFPSMASAQYYIPADTPLEHLFHFALDQADRHESHSYEYPFQSKTFEQILEQFPVQYFSRDSLAVRTSVGVSLFDQDQILKTRPAFYFSSPLQSGFHFGTQLVASTSRSGDEELGTEVGINNYYARVQRAWLNYDSEHLEVVTGRDALQLGPGRFSSLLLDRHLPPYDLFRIRLSKSVFNLYGFTAFLPPVQSSYRPENYVNRYLSGKRLSYRHQAGNFGLAVGDMILYSGENRPFDPALSNPVLPVYLLVHGEKRYRFTPELDGDNENSILYADGFLTLSEDHTVYSQVIIDEFHVNPARRDTVDDAVGYTIGYTGVLPLNSKYTIHIQSEFTRVNSWVYIHPGQLTTMLYKDRPIGNSEGGDIREFHFRADLWSGYRWSVGLQFSGFQEGEITMQNEWNPYSTKGKGFPVGTVERTNSITIDGYYFTKMFRFLRIYTEYRSTKNMEHIPGNNQQEWRYGLEFYYYLTL
ncbi:MAG: hypothetical protein GF372_09970 [Candidatus Marinimicrobia bacterium]|nr:hypothetical protein [Candidatus Neomarinimicrobiota bacterium]